MADFYQERLNGGAVFNGAVLIQASGKIGGTKSVFVQLTGAAKDGLVYPTFGGKLLNPFKGPAKAFVGDIVEYTDGLGDGETGGASVKILKSYEVAVAATATDTDIYLVRDGFKHVPFVGDNIMVGGKSFATKGKGVTVTAVEVTTQNDADVWKVTLSETLGSALKVGDVLVEAAEAGASVLPMVTNPNAYFPSDFDFGFTPRTTETDYTGGALYLVTPALAHPSAVLYKAKMSPIPPALLALNTAKVASWFAL